MSPLRRPIALIGLLAIMVTAWMAFRGELGLADAGLRAAMVLVFVQFLDRTSTWGLRHAAGAAARVSSRGQITANRPESELRSDGAAKEA